MVPGSEHIPNARTLPIRRCFWHSGESIADAPYRRRRIDMEAGRVCPTPDGEYGAHPAFPRDRRMPEASGEAGTRLVA